jgi:16S rRNA (cytosine1402-N4)-methyltransferase
MHIPVLLNEVIKYLDPKPNENFIDCTMGQGGHAVAILEKIGPMGKILGIDLDGKQIENCRRLKERFNNRLILANDNYANLKNIAEQNNFFPINGILLDLGFSSFHTDESQKGFSFLKNEPLDMRYNLQNNLTARQIINEWPEKEIEKILEEYGEEKFAKKISKKIAEARQIKKIETTLQLVGIIEKAIPGRRKGDIHCATRTFQALRIAVNDELENLKNILPQAVSILSSGGRLAVISFHSLEDRIVKSFFKETEKENIAKILFKKPITASEQEILENPRARSAKLRAIIKI